MSVRYKITESVGGNWEDVHQYKDLEKHHPTWREDPAKRHYAEIDGRREEYVYSPSGDRMISKDFVLTVDGTTAVHIPSPVSGYVRRSARMDRWGTVEIYDGPNQDAHLIARVRHMDPIVIAEGQVRYGAPLGQQNRRSPPGTRVGLHTHIDINERYLDVFKQYIQDLDTGVITPDQYPDKYLRNRSFPQLNHTAHCDHGLYSAIQNQLPAGTEQTVVANLVLHAKQCGILDASQLQGVSIGNGYARILGTTPGFRTVVDLSAPMESFEAISERLNQAVKMPAAIIEPESAVRSSLQR